MLAQPIADRLSDSRAVPLAEPDDSWEVSARVEGIRKPLAVLPRSVIPL